MGWDGICKPKLSGGLGFRGAVDLNRAMLSTMSWFRTANDNSFTTELLKNEYGNYLLPLNRHASNCSPLWRDLQIYGDVIQRCCCSKLVGNGEQAKVRTEPWIPGIESFRPTPSPTSTVIDTSLTVKELIIDGQWNLSLLEVLFDNTTIQNILKIHLGNIQTEDKSIWTRNMSGEHSVKNLFLSYREGRFKKGNEAYWKNLRGLKVHECLKLHLRRMVTGSLPQWFGMFIMHLFSQCPYIRIPWGRSVWDVSNCAPQGWNGDLKSLIEFPLSVAKTELETSRHGLLMMLV